MATVIFIDQENGGVASTILSKDRLKSTIPGKTLLKSRPGKVFDSSVTVVKPRKALGNVNTQVVNTAVPQKKGALGVKNSAPVTKQASEACIKPSKRNYPEIEKCVPYDPADISSILPSFLATFDIALDLPQISEACIKPSKQGYPEIEKCLPYHPEEFETFDVPEECKLSHLYLAGVPLFVYENGFALSTKEPIPMDIPIFSWESDISSTCPSFLATLDEVTLDMPKMENC
ncbi:securin-like isoform X2 [Rana temporaria]|uniref:securin-like isoform X2 n=1 Tax=Rana temporaria TaxID=8407 RepID=UPI001AADD399|nr:securin-like isoform X2 [Rana temporaria]